MSESVNHLSPLQSTCRCAVDVVKVGMCRLDVGGSPGVSASGSRDEPTELGNGVQHSSLRI